MSEDMLTQIQRDLLDIKRRLSRLEANDKSAVTEWTAWTPELYGATTAGTFTYTNQEGYYFIIDNTVFIYGRCTINTITVGATGALRIRTLPFNTDGNNLGPLMIQARINLTAGYTMYSANFPNANNFISIIESGDNLLQAFPSASLAAGDDVRFAGFYKTA